jgi:DNA-binding NarL/FixJ family response regulator
MDIHLPGKSGIACVTKLRPMLPKTQIIMLTIEEDSEQVFDSMKAGATGYLVKHSSLEEILEAIADVHSGGAPMSSQIARKVVTTFRKPIEEESTAVKLSAREEAVLVLLAKGYRSKEVAKDLGIGLGTVNTYIRNIYEKLHVRSRAEAVARFIQR